MSHTPLKEMSYQEVLEFILGKYSDFEDEVKRRYIADNIKLINPYENKGRWQEWLREFQEYSSIPLSETESWRFKLEIVEETYEKYVLPYLSQYDSPSRQLVD